VKIEHALSDNSVEILATRQPIASPSGYNLFPGAIGGMQPKKAHPLSNAFPHPKPAPQRLPTNRGAVSHVRAAAREETARIHAFV